MLGARLAVLASDARSVLLAGATSDVPTDGLARAVVTALGETGRGARAVDLADNPDLAAGGSSASPASTVTVIAGRGLLDDPATLLTARRVDAIVVVVRRGRTTRRDLQEVRRELMEVGAPLVGSIVVD